MPRKAVKSINKDLYKILTSINLNVNITFGNWERGAGSRDMEKWFELTEKYFFLQIHLDNNTKGAYK
jgi:hypothetical protein